MPTPEDGGKHAWPPRNLIQTAIEGVDVSDRPCDGLSEDGLSDAQCQSGIVGMTRLYTDGHIFQLCPECAWRLTDLYHADGFVAPWEGEAVA
jgi:hypothetical protein